MVNEFITQYGVAVFILGILAGLIWGTLQRYRR